MYGVFLKCSDKKLKQIIKTSLYKRPSYCNFFRELYARYFPKEEDSSVMQWVISSWEQLGLGSHFEDIFENWNRDKNTVMSTFWHKKKILSSPPPALNSKDVFHVTCTCILSMWSALWPFYIDKHFHKHAHHMQLLTLHYLFASSWNCTSLTENCNTCGSHLQHFLLNWNYFSDL